jgi:hypothetical protein
LLDADFDAAPSVDSSARCLQGSSLIEHRCGFFEIATGEIGVVRHARGLEQVSAARKAATASPNRLPTSQLAR